MTDLNNTLELMGVEVRRELATRLAYTFEQMMEEYDIAVSPEVSNRTRERFDSLVADPSFFNLLPEIEWKVG